MLGSTRKPPLTFISLSRFTGGDCRHTNKTSQLLYYYFLYGFEIKPNFYFLLHKQQQQQPTGNVN